MMLFPNLNRINNHFIIAPPRSGTTWMSKMLNAHPQINCIERRLFGNYADFILDDGQNSPRLRVTLDKYVNSLLLHHGIPNSNKDNVMRSIIKGITKEEYHVSKKKIVIDKITPYLNTSDNVIQAITQYFPNAKIIYLVRDGRDVLTSGVFHWFNKQPKETILNDFEVKRRNVYLNNDKANLERFFQDKEIQQWATEWKQPLQTIGKAKESHDVKVVHYEEMLLNTANVIADCLTFFNAKTNKGLVTNCVNAASFEKMSQGRNQGEAKANAHVRKGISGDWQNYFTYQDGKLFNEIAGDGLINFGYEENKNWFERLR